MTIHKKRNAVIAAVAGGALLLGGSTYALWSASADLGGTQIQAGDLSLTTDHVTLYDVSPWVSTLSSTDDMLTPLETNVVTPDGRVMASGKTLAYDSLVYDGKLMPNFNPWKASPGDVLLIQIPFTVNLSGDNLVAKLDATLDLADSQDSAFVGLTQYASVQYALFATTSGTTPVHSEAAPSNEGLTPVYQDGTGASYSAYSPAGTMTTYLSTSANTIATNLTDGATPTVQPGQSTYNLSVFVTFNDAVNDQQRDGINEVLGLENAVSLSLTQVRN
ncbi:MAG: SipW-dependent-type signal peptide-containing protein [Propionibacteriaceae bacterium]|nr:SipW-dependent-type signal peptide-containing protein [Propionibacteriaceae bacterium]